MTMSHLRAQVDQLQAILARLQYCLTQDNPGFQGQVSQDLDRAIQDLQRCVPADLDIPLTPSLTPPFLAQPLKNAAVLQSEEAWVPRSLRQAHAGAWKWDLIHGTYQWSPEMKTLFGYAEAEEISDPALFLGLILPEDREEIGREIDEALQRGGPFYTEFRIKTMDGRMLWVSVAGTVDHDPSGRPLQAAGISQDITARKQAEEALQAAEQRERANTAEMEALMDAVPAIIWISRDAECKEMLGNRYGYEFLHMWEGANLSKTAPVADIAQQPYRVFKDGKEIPNNELPMQIAAATGVGTSDYEFDLVFEEGSIRNLLGNVVPLFDLQGKPSGVVGAFLDVTQRVAAERVLRENNIRIAAQSQQLEAREKERVKIARDIHDGPIQTITGALMAIHSLKPIIRDPVVRAEIEPIGENIKSVIRELRSIINELRPPVLARFGLVKAVQKLVEEAQEKTPAVDFILDLPEDVDTLSDPLCLTLYRICQEAINNILRHSRATQAAIQISNANPIVLTINDNGVGFDPIQDFADLSENNHFGLVGMKERAEALGGSFSVLSQPGEGTAIHVIIPGNGG